MSKLEEAIQAHREPGRKLATIARERNRLPAQITAAIESGDSAKLAELKSRQITVEAEHITASIADKKTAIEFMEAELTEASAKAA